MNSCNRCGRSLSSNEESSSTGAAETRRSFKFSAEMSLAVDTEGDGKRKNRIRELGGHRQRSEQRIRRPRRCTRLFGPLCGPAEGDRGSTSHHCPITPKRTPFSFATSNQATFCPNQVLFPESLYFLTAAAKSRALSRYATGDSPNFATCSESQPPPEGAASMTGSPGK